MRVIAAWHVVFVSCLILDSKMAEKRLQERMAQSKEHRYRMEAGMPSFQLIHGLK
jgi:hypothetical protein